MAKERINAVKEPTYNQSIKLKQTVVQKLRAIMKAEDRSMNYLIVKAVEEYLEKYLDAQ